MKPERIKQVRAKLGFTQKQCADIIGVQSNTWARYESGLRAMSPQLWRLFCMLTDTDETDATDER